MNVLFVDSPVGTGFSYVTDDELLVTTDGQLAEDLVFFITEFFSQFPQYMVSTSLDVFFTLINAFVFSVLEK